MTLLSTGELSLTDAFVCLDLETTGLDADQDLIIEVGAVRFRGADVVDTFTSLVNPRRQLTPFIQRLTGIKQAEVDAAQPFAAIAGQVREFVGDSPIIGHNVQFDIGFLQKAGVHFPGPVFDTRDLASILLPGGNYSLNMLARSLGVPPWNAHRGLDDAAATQRVFNRLVDLALAMDPGVVAEIARLARVANWPLARLLSAVTAEQAVRGVTRTAALGGVDTVALERRIRPQRRTAAAIASDDARDWMPHDPAEMAATLVGADGAMATVAPGFEHRVEQERMLAAVAEAFERGHHLVVEAGTGVGKSMAYLLPAAAFALRNNTRVVVSTNTIGLQEQLAGKDVAMAARTLEAAGVAGAAELRYTTLKGRANYLCLRRWSHMRSGQTLTVDEARFLGKLTTWLQDTVSGDRADLRMARPDNNVWDRLNAQGSRQCPTGEGACFLRAARDRADAASIVIVNHSLLLADLAMGGGLIPDYDHLVIDEAQHLEAEATSQLSSRVAHAQAAELLDEIANPRGLVMDAVNAFRMSPAAQSRRQATADAAQAVVQAASRARDRLDEFFPLLLRYVQSRNDAPSGQQNPLRVTSSVRAQPDWAALEVAWENPSSALGDLARALGSLYASLDGLEENDVTDYDTIRSELASREGAVIDLRELGDRFMYQADAESIFWVEGAQLSNVALCTAPLHVGEILRERLFERRESIVLTSATLTVAGSFEPLRERLGLRDAQELLLGSPFNYPQSALVCIPRDMPEPNSPGYAATIARAVTELARAAGGHTLALFTSHASLRAAAELARGALEGEGIRVLAQGVDGAPAALIEEFLGNPQALLLGTASFWEGIDLAGDALTVLALTRLPFDVPSEPVFAARSEGYEEPFREYAVPQAVLRFRQGFGRLIRTASDRGVVAVLDRRLTARSYGQLFLKSLPDCTVEQPRLAEMPDIVQRWLASRPSDPAANGPRAKR